MTTVSICQQQAPTSAASVHTAPSATIIDAAVVCNPTASSDTLTLWLVQDGGTQADDNVIYDALTVDAGATEVLGALHGMSMIAGAKLFLLAGASATALTVTITGRR